MKNTTKTTDSILKPFPRKFVEESFTINGWEDIEPYFKKLNEAQINSAEEMELWLTQWSELQAVVDEHCTRRYIEMTCHTDDEDKKNAYLECVRDIEPKQTEWSDRLNRKYVASPARKAFDQDEYGRLDRMIKESVELFDEKNIPLQVTLQELSQKYQETMGAMTVLFEGEERTMPQMTLYLREQDRPKRQSAFSAMVARRLKEKDTLEGLFDEMLVHRVEWAKNLGLADYREYCFRSKLRDYTAEDCKVFHDAIEKAVVPLAKKIMERRRAEMGIDVVNPWDTACDTKGRPSLKPFKKPEELYGGVKEIFSSVDSRLGDMFGAIGFSMDLESRKGKAPGGYQATLSEARVPFIFTNAVGTQDDVNTMLHEGGHAFHALQCRGNDLIWYRHAAMEFSEVASMSMELIGGQKLQPFYQNDDEIARAKRERMESIVSLFPWVAQVDAFQHWIYTNPEHSREERKKTWLNLSDRFSTGVDWSNAPDEALDYSWHRQLHIFEVPFYYVEYAIAQLGALQIYRNYKNDPDNAMAGYLSALSLGGSHGAKKLFEAAGIKFDFSAPLLSSLMGLVEEELES